MTPPDRRAARDLWLRVTRGAVSWDGALETTPSFLSLKGRDRAFAYRLAASALRHHNILSHWLKILTGRGNLKPPELEAVLHLGLCQIMFLDTKPHAAVSTTVDMVPQQQKGLANAVLRRAAREKDELLAQTDLVATAAPKWLWKQLVADYGQQQARDIIEFCLAEPAIDLTLKNPARSADWAMKLQADIHPFGALRLREGGAIAAMPGFDTGDWWVQDAAASLPAQVAGRDLSGKTALDLCAAPGGKTLQLAAAGAKVTAVDIDGNRLRRVAENAARCGLSDRVVCVESDALNFKDGQFDVVLLDAPCSASGTLRRHPDMWVQSEGRDIEGFAKLQAQLLDHAAKLVAKDGVLIYAVCSLDKREGETQADRFISGNKNYSIYTNNNENEFGRIFPDKSQSDGFFFMGFKRQF